MSRSISINDIDLSKCGPNSPLHALAKRRDRAPADVDREHREQAALFSWASDNASQHPELVKMFAIPNFSGFYGSKSARMKAAARARAEGLKKDMLDLMLPCARGPYHGLFIEMKVPGKYPRPGQRWWMQALTDEGYLAIACVGWEAARESLLHYLNLGSPSVSATL